MGVLGCPAFFAPAWNPSTLCCSSPPPLVPAPALTGALSEALRLRPGAWEKACRAAPLMPPIPPTPALEVLPLPPSTGSLEPAIPGASPVRPRPLLTDFPNLNSSTGSATWAGIDQNLEVEEVGATTGVVGAGLRAWEGGGGGRLDIGCILCPFPSGRSRTRVERFAQQSSRWGLMIEGETEMGGEM